MKSHSYELSYRRLTRISSKERYPALTEHRARLFLSHWPNDSAGWLILGNALVQMARYEEAQEAIEKSISLCPKDSKSIPLGQMGHLFRERGMYEEAASWYRKASVAEPEDATYRIFLGSVLEKEGRLREAEKTLRSAAICPEGCIDEAYYCLGLVLRDQQKFEEAAKCFQEAIRLDPNYRIARRALRDVELCLKEIKGSNGPT